MEYGLIGEKLGHSFSKPIHEKLVRYHEIKNYSYEIRPVSRGEFADFMEKKDFKAINVTIPYKSDVIPYLSEIDEHAKKIGAVNTIVNRSGQLHGYNTDFYGFLYTLKHHHMEVKGKKVFVLGNGGAAKAVLAVLSYLGASEIIIVKYREDTDCITYEEALKSHRDVSYIINTSPVGMYPNTEASPMDLAPYTNLKGVVDIIYNPLKTKLLLQAESLGLPAINGLEMLIAQAKQAAEIFLDTSIPDSATLDIYAEMMKELSQP
ncbi:shikimate dehydrogenase family protein [Anaerocolumna xylanovorans]|uniref:Shikimate dehydrogenase n=1 Tax=Anaerocolumna xylanovorans DSM 12503 TaxID=1121345 RepID=A0A1M7YIZ1_9FIRM|nr:shikimate dehydrogenase [Anaerocolumna xylanovorans]SHO52586.1 shikimate dehydrogenase [Anaerocolumna xylanovorans DSM 12503]